MKNCPCCGSLLDDNARFCNKCGTQQPMGTAQNFQNASQSQFNQQPQFNQQVNYQQPQFNQQNAYNVPKEPTMPFDIALTRAFQNSFKFNGRAARAEYWWLFLAGTLLWVGLRIIARIIYSDYIYEIREYGYTDFFLDYGSFGSYFFLFLFYATVILAIPTFSCAIRRLHDVGRSGWWVLCPIYNIVLLASKGNPGANQYGGPVQF